MTMINPSMYNQTLNNPAMQGQGVSSDKVKQDVKAKVDNTLVAKRMDEASESPATMALIPPVWIALVKLMDKFNAKCAGSYDKSLPGRVANFGTRIDNSAFMNSAPIKAAGKFFNGIGNFVKTKIVGKSKILSAMAHTPSQPTNKMVLTQAKGIISQYTNDYTTVVDKFLEAPKDFKSLGLNDATIARISKRSPESIRKIFDQLQLRNITKDKNIIKRTLKLAPEKRIKVIEALKLKQIGLNPVKYGKIKVDAASYVDDIIKACQKTDPSIVVKMGKNKLLARKVTFDQFANKMTAIAGKGKKGFTKFLPKSFMALTEAITNGTAGGKLFILAQAYIIADAAVKAYKAPKGEKGKTFAERMTNDAAYFLTMPLGIKMMHSIGGLRYTGMDKAAVSSYRTALKTFNATTFASKADYTTALKSLKGMLKGNSKGPISWIAKKIGGFVKTGLEMPKAYLTGKGTDILKKLPNAFKNGAGNVIRVGLYFMVLAPFFSKLCVKACHKIFGKPTNSVLDEGKEKNKPADPAANPQTTPAAVNPQQPATTVNQPQTTTTPVQPKSDTNLLDLYKNKPAVAPQPQSQTTQLQEPVRTYVPSATGVQVQQDPTTSDKATLALKRANSAEQEALKFLAGA